MDDELRQIAGDDQFDAARREARRMVTALAGDVIAYHEALTGAGIDGELVATLTEQFNARWLGPVESDAQIVFSMGADDEGAL